MDVSIITVNTNDGEKLLPQIDSVQKACAGISYEQIVSDNGSTDNSLEQIQSQFPHVKIVKNGKNVGFGAANNAALPQATGEFLLLLNPDMRLEAGSLKIFIDWMRAHPHVGIASPKLVKEDGAVQHSALPRRFPTVWDQLAIVLKLPHLFPGILKRYLCDGFDPDKEQSVDSVRGSFMLIRREIVDTLGWAFDPRYFIWFEDVDTCREVQRLGYDVVYSPVVSCVDYVGQTFKKQPSVMKQRWFTASMLAYFKKWHPTWQYIVLLAARPLGIALTWIESRLRS